MKTILSTLLLVISLLTHLPLLAKCSIPELGEDKIISFERSNQSKNKEHWLLQVSGPTGTYSVNLTVYLPRKKKISLFNSDEKKFADLMILYPTIDGEGTLEGAVARYFSKHDYYVAIPTIEELKYRYDDDTACQMDQMLRRVQQTSVFTFEKLSKLSPKGRKFLIGASQGGIRSVSSASVIPDLVAVWANVAGGDFPSVYARSNVDQIARFRARHMTSLNMTESEQYESYLRQSLLLDPVLLCPDRMGRLAMVVALEDTSVPAYNQKLLEDSCQPEKVRYLESGHVRGVVDLWLKRADIRAFLESKDNI